MMMNWGMMNLGMILYMLFLILVFGFLIYGITALIMKLFNKDTTSTAAQKDEHDSSLQILKERYAKGELTETEFEQKYEFLRDKL